jgi:hypothetical protein
VCLGINLLERWWRELDVQDVVYGEQELLTGLASGICGH